ncbi:MAG TPA: ribonuclease G [Gammaproteobacteria bacterium]|nr:ribonuclease G [Gammaproteobacteria bacterium]HET7588039.1 ribonuclease G [Gammaproteobacteria bacterium]
MSEEILINVTPRETRVALLENGALEEIFIERAHRRGLVGNIYKGRVLRVLPGMQAAFVDVGLERSAFLHASDISRAVYTEAEQEPHGPADIRELLHEGDELLVQVLKDPLGTKGARLSTRIGIPSRYLVHVPGSDRVGVSARIDDEAERERLAGLVAQFLDGGTGGYIVRTAGEGVSHDAIRADMMFLRKLWELIEEQSRSVSTGALVHEDLLLPVRILRDFLDDEVEQVRVDTESVYRKMKDFAAMFLPELAGRIEFYDGPRPIFDLYGIEDEIHKALERKVALKSGGYLVIDQTEAMTTIDVNTGAYVGYRNLEETVLKTNLEASQTIARQLRLRNLGGIIIIDFIDMHEPEHRQLVLEALERSLARDHARNKICAISPLGLVEMTRKRTRESLEHVLCQPCPTCAARGSIKTPETVCYDIFREILGQTRTFDIQELRVLASQEVIDLLLDEESESLAEIEGLVGRPIRLQVESLYNPESFDVVPV